MKRMTTEEFLDTGLLEEYVMGLCSAEEQSLVEQYINTDTSVREIYDQIQHSISQLADSYAIEPPAGVKARLMDQLEGKASPPTTNGVSSIGRYLLWAIVPLAALLGIVAVTKIGNLQDDVRAAEVRYAALQKECSRTQQQADAVAQSLRFYKSPATLSGMLRGGAIMPKFEAVAHYNKQEGRYTMEVLSIGSMPAGKCLYLWGDKDGHMVKLQKLEDVVEGNQYVFDPAMESFNLTLEDVDVEAEEPDVSNLVASVSI